MIVVFDLGGPLLAYALLHRAGMSAVSALVISGVLPAIGIALGALVDGRLDIIGVVVLGGIVVGTVLGLVSHNARLFLLEGSVPSLAFALACLASLKASKPLIYRFAVEILGPDTPKGRDVTGAWQYRGFRRAFQVITMAWGIGYLVEVAIRVLIIETTSTGIALLGSKLLPYAFALALSAWTFGYGEHEKRKAERQAAAATRSSESEEVSSAPLYTRPGAPHADRDQRLPAASGRHPVVRPRAGHPPSGGHGDRLRPGLGGRRRVRRRAALPGGPPSDVADAAGPRGPAPRRDHRSRARL